MSVAVVSANFGGYDVPEVPCGQTVDCEWVMVTDSEVPVPAPWRAVFVPPSPAVEHRLRSRVPKCRPDLFATADVFVWVDALVVPTAPDFVAWLVAHVAVGSLAVVRHPQIGARGTSAITEEAQQAAYTGKYQGQPLHAQAAYYVEHGYPDEWGLWECRIMVRRNNDELRRFGDAWLREQVRWGSSMDQLPLCALAHDRGLRPVDIDPADAYARCRMGNHTRLV